MNEKSISILFYLSALYDGLLGMLFLFAPCWAFQYFQVPPPNHLGYVQFPALLLLIFAVMFYRVAKEPERHTDLILYGIMLKISYCSITGLYWLQGTLPGMWQPFTICDAIMGILYVWAFLSLQKHEQTAAPA